MPLPFANSRPWKAMSASVTKTYLFWEILLIVVMVSLGMDPISELGHNCGNEFWIQRARSLCKRRACASWKADLSALTTSIPWNRHLLEILLLYEAEISDIPSLSPVCCVCTISFIKLFRYPLLWHHGMMTQMLPHLWSPHGNTSQTRRFSL